MNKQPWLSVLIPTYNGERFLSKALDSIAKQADPGIECIIVDDGSTDATLSIVRMYEKRLRLICECRERSGNWVQNTNFAMSIGRGNYACFLHQDDIWLENRLLMLERLTRQHPETEVFLGSAYFIDENERKLGPWRCPLPPLPKILGADECLEHLLVQNFVPIPAPIFRLKAALEVGGMDETSWYTADWDFWLRLAARGRLAYYPRPLVGFRIHKDSQTVRRSSSEEDFRTQHEKVAQRHLSLWQAPQAKLNKVRQLSDFSIEVNTTLAGAIHGTRPNALRLVGGFLALGPVGVYKYLRDSRIWERASARIRARLA